MLDYDDFIQRKSQLNEFSGFDPIWIPDFLYPFQKSLVDWAIRKGKAAIFADCGLGKTPMQLVWAQNVIQKTNKPVLILAPLAVGVQTVDEGNKFSIPCERSRDGLYHSKNIVITNYEKLHLFDCNDFGGVVCDESSILKHFSGATQKAITRFMLKTPYRLLCTATAAPNDYIELGTSSEALGELGYSDMLTRFFRQTDNKPHRMEEIKQWRKQQMEGRDGSHFAKLSFRVHQSINGWKLKGHAVEPFWKWIASWARACRKPSDLGCDDGPFILPELIENSHLFNPRSPADGMLFVLPAFGMREEREERRRTLKERCEFAANLVDNNNAAVIWCHMNSEGDLLEKLISGSRQIKGTTSEEEREEIYTAFGQKQLRVIIIKPKIGAWGLNWQHCNHVVTFASHSYEQYYQSVRRCWRFGQKMPVTVDVIATTGEKPVLENMHRKAEAYQAMFAALVAQMNNALILKPNECDYSNMEIPQWIR